MYYRQPFAGSYPITQGYGEYIPGVTVGSSHTGIDYGCPLNTPILASESGSVVFAGWDNTGYGNCVIIQHPDGNATLYAHLSMISVTVGQKVSPGQIIGYSGASGNATGPHLHFEARHTWNDYTSHFDPMTLPLHSVVSPLPPSNESLKGADSFHAGELLKVQNDLGVKAYFSTSFADYCTYPKGTPFYYTGESTVRKSNGLTYMKVVPATFTVWVAVNDGDVQILDEA